MLKTIVLSVLALVVAAGAGLLIVAAFKPDRFRIERAAAIRAPAERIQSFIEDFHRWTAWSPWEKKDPALKRSYAGAAAGKGAVYEWDGDRNVGQGRMEILESSPARVLIKLDFLKPFEAHNTAEFTLTPAGDGTMVTWAMTGPQPFLAKVMGTVFNMDRMVGGDFEAGLAALKAQAER